MGLIALHLFHLHSPPSIGTSSPVSPLLLGWITPCASSGPVPLVTSLVSVSCAVLVVMLGRVPDADDHPCETEGRGVESCSVSSAIFFWDSGSGGAGPLQYAPHSKVLRCVPLDCVSQCTIDSFVSRSQSFGSSRVDFQQALDPLPACFAESFLSSLARYGHPGQPSLRPHCSKSALRW